VAQAPIGSSTRKRKEARLHLHSQSVFPEVSCSQQAISLIDAVWIQFSGFRTVNRQLLPWDYFRLARDSPQIGLVRD